MIKFKNNSDIQYNLSHKQYKYSNNFNYVEKNIASGNTLTHKKRAMILLSSDSENNLNSDNDNSRNILTFNIKENIKYLNDNKINCNFSKKLNLDKCEHSDTNNLRHFDFSDNKLEEISSNLETKKYKIYNNNKEYSSNIIKDFLYIKYKNISSYYIENYSYLSENYPKLFKKGTKIKFKINILSNLNYRATEYIYGVVNQYVPISKSLIVRCFSIDPSTLYDYSNKITNSKNYSIDNYFDKKCLQNYEKSLFDHASLLLSVQLKNFIELNVEIDDHHLNLNNSQFENELKDEYKIKKCNDNNFENNKSAFETLIRQVEFYLSNPYFSKNTYLCSIKDELNCKIIN